MANPKHVEQLKNGTLSWNAWREETLRIKPDFSQADLRGVQLRDVDLSGAILRRADLTGADLRGATLIGADLSGAIVRNTRFVGASLFGALLNDVHLNDADLSGADLREATFTGTNFTGAIVWETLLVNVDLSQTTGLTKAQYLGPFTIDYRTMARSGKLPATFLRGSGLPEFMLQEAIQLQERPSISRGAYLCYPPQNRAFANRLHVFLQESGVRCWLSPMNGSLSGALVQALEAGQYIIPILSENSIYENWMADVVETGLKSESSAGDTLIFPVRLDDKVFDTRQSWAQKLQDDRTIGNFSAWYDETEWQTASDQLLNYLTAVDLLF